MAYLSLTTVIPARADVASTVAAAVAAAPGDSRILRVPVYREFIADLETPVSTYLKLHDGATSSFLLETVEGGERLGRYSFVGSDPADTIRVGEGCPHSGDPLTVLETFLKQSRLVIPRGVKLPEFTGGAVGYVGYDCVRFFEPRTAGALTSQTDVLHIPDAVFLIANTVVVFDHVRHTIKIVGHASVSPTATVAEIDAAYAAACADIEGVLARLSRPLSFRLQAPPSSPLGKTQAAGGGAAAVASPSTGAPATGSLSESQPTFDWSAASNMGRAGYEGAVRSLQDHVVNGNIIQAVPSHRVSRALPPDVSAFDVYRQLRVVNPSPYMFFLHLSDDFQVLQQPALGRSSATGMSCIHRHLSLLQIVGASPEMLVRVDGKGMCFTHPIAGTRRRGADDKEDDELAAELLADEKERAEHIMLVDLGRNDLGRVASPGSVHVDSLMHVERYSHVMHIVTNREPHGCGMDASGA